MDEDESLDIKSFQPKYFDKDFIEQHAYRENTVDDVTAFSNDEQNRTVEFGNLSAPEIRNKTQKRTRKSMKDLQIAAM